MCTGSGTVRTEALQHRPEWDEISPAFLEACSTKKVDSAWSIWSECFETSLLDAQPVPGKNLGLKSA
jgi:hypothetical protein